MSVFLRRQTGGSLAEHVPHLVHLTVGTAALGLVVTGQEVEPAVAVTLALGAFLAGATAVSLGGKHRLLSPAFLYVAVLGVFHLPLAAFWLAGMDINTGTNWLRSASLSTSLLLCAVAFSALAVGVRLCRGRWLPDLSRREKPARLPQPAPENGTLFAAGVCLGLLAAALIAAGALQVGLFAGTYSEYHAAGQAGNARLFNLGLLLYPVSGAMIVAGGRGRGRALGVAILAYLFVLGPLFLFGFRGPLLVTLVGLLPGIYAKLPRYAARAAVVGFCAVLFVAPLVRLSRSDGTDALHPVPPVAFLAETGTSLRPLVGTVELVDAGVTEPWHGSSYLVALKNVAPNMGAASDAGRPTDRPGAWITWMTEPVIFAHGGGIGYSGVAEPYLNFGIIGVVLFFLALGWLLEWGAGAASRSAAVMAFCLCAFASVLSTVRNDSTNAVRPVAWGGAVILAAYLLDRVLARRRSVDVAARGTRLPATVVRRAGWSAQAAGGPPAVPGGGIVNAND